MWTGKLKIQLKTIAQRNSSKHEPLLLLGLTHVQECSHLEVNVCLEVVEVVGRSDQPDAIVRLDGSASFNHVHHCNGTSEVLHKTSTV